MKINYTLSALAVISTVLLAACGGGGESAAIVAPPITEPTDADRAKAATDTANTNALCAASALGSYYWEVGDVNGATVSGTVGGSPPSATTMMSIASASKWVYSTYVLQKAGVRTSDVPVLNFTSGYTEFKLPLCSVSDTVASCVDGNDGQEADTVGEFFYGSGHMQHHALASMGLGNMGTSALTAEIFGVVGNFDMEYSQPQLAGGLVGNAAGYAEFLRSILRGTLVMRDSLGNNKVCTNSLTCSTALASPISDTESWNYSLGHWVEDDPTFGDGAFSSAGALGFYPWIDSTKTLYGVLARRADGESNAGYNSARCGRLIRQAWVTGKAV